MKSPSASRHDALGREQRAPAVQESSPHAQRDATFDGRVGDARPALAAFEVMVDRARDGDQLDRRLGRERVVVDRFAALERLLVERLGALRVEGRASARVDEQRLGEQRLVAGRARSRRRASPIGFSACQSCPDAAVAHSVARRPRSDCTRARSAVVGQGRRPP